MREQIYINGELMDQQDGKYASLVWQSPFFTEIDSIVSNRSNSIDFPVTRNNLKAIDNCHLYGSDSVYSYRRHRVVYYRDGIQLFAGYGTLLSLTATSIRFTFTWGSIAAFQKLLDTKLQDLSGDTTHIAWNSSYQGSYMSSNLSFGYYGHPHPIVPVSDILTLLQEVSGVTILNAGIFDKYVIPCVSKKADDAAKRAQGTIITGRTAGNVYVKSTYNGSARPSYTVYETRLAVSLSAGDKDSKELYNDLGVFDVSEVETLEITFKQGFRFQSPGSDGTQIRIVRTDETGIYSNRGNWAGIPVSRVQYGSVYRYTVNEDTTVKINCSEWSYLKIVLDTYTVLNGSSTATTGASIVTNNGVSLVADLEQDQEVEWGSMFPLWLNLPDWDGAQLLKNLMKLEGVFPAVEDNAIRFVSIDCLYDNRGSALDWTDRLIFTDRRPSEQSSSLSGYAQKNICKYAEDNTVKASADGVIEIADETLDKENELLSLDFAATDGNTIYAYTKDGNSDVQFSEVQPRILRYKEEARGVNPAVTFDGLSWPELISTKYAKYVNTIQKVRILKASLLINAVELSTLDMKTPVYSAETGHYYAITKLTTKTENTADVELLQLGGTTRSTSASEESMEIALCEDLEGGFYISMPKSPGSVVASLVASGQYKLFLIRYGYTRKGKNVTRYDRVKQKDSWTHTYRNKYYKRQRKGLCWRIIGRDIIEHGSIPSHSAASSFYSGATLVFDLLQTIVLPPLGKITRSSFGRIKNESHRGKVELYVGLYHKNGNGWDLCSNRVRVRGRTSDLKNVWDFSENNIVV